MLWWREGSEAHEREALKILRFKITGREPWSPVGVGVRVISEASQPRVGWPALGQICF
jgi:hypothetical protein